jgi:hypothetical protein
MVLNIRDIRESEFPKSPMALIIGCKYSISPIVPK